MIGRVTAYISIFYAALIPAVVGVLFLISDGQPREILRIWGQSSHPAQMLIAALFLLYCSIILFSLHLRLASIASLNLIARGELRWPALITSLAPIIALAVIVATLAFETRGIEFDTWYSFEAFAFSQSEFFRYGLLFSFLLILILVAYKIINATAIAICGFSSRDINALLLIQIITIFAILAWFEISIPHLLGPINILILFVAFLGVLIYFFSLVMKRVHPSVLGLVVGIVVLSNVLESSDNHKIRQTRSPETLNRGGMNSEQIGTTVNEAFSSWLEARPDKERFDTYPVYIVAAAGGGAYAAQHSAFVLGRLQDLCPHFSQHVFAISGVSGGALGASLFAALAKDRAEPVKSPVCRGPTLVGNFTTSLADMLSVDFLSPVLARGLFADIFQRLIPFAGIEQFDRARSLEKTIEHAWRTRGGQKREPEVFGRDYLSFWRPDGIAPAVLSNVTEVGSGTRFVISPFRLSGATAVHDVADANPNLNMPLSTAVVLSARFPVLTPSGWFEIDQASEIASSGGFQDRTKIHLVDGGYYDNSGIATAMDIIHAIKPITGSNRTRHEIILLIIDSIPDPHKRVNWLTQILSPAHALLNVRAARSKEYRERVRWLLPDLDRDPDFFDFVGLGRLRTAFTFHRKESVREFWLDLNAKGDDLNIPLGWYLSERMSKYIWSEVGNPWLCNSNAAKRFVGPHVRVSKEGAKMLTPDILEWRFSLSRHSVHCRMLAILDELTPDTRD